jgi:putative transposase
MYAFIEAERETYGVEPICEVLEIAPSGYRASRAQQQDSTKRCARAQRDDVWRETIRRVWLDNHGVYAAGVKIVVV